MRPARSIELRCTYDPATKGGNAPDGRKVKATMHWVSAADSVPAEVRLYNPLFTKPDPNAGDFAADLNPHSLEILADARVEPALAGQNSDDAVQFERQGYFCRDKDSEARPACVQPHRRLARHLGEGIRRRLDIPPPCGEGGERSEPDGGREATRRRRRLHRTSRPPPQPLPTRGGMPASP